MSTRTLTMVGTTDTFLITPRPLGTPDDRYQPLPAGMTTDLAVVVPAVEVRRGDVVLGEFSAGPGVRDLEHMEDAFLAMPTPVIDCDCDHDETCEPCVDIDEFGLDAHRYLCLRPAGDRYDCLHVFRNAPVAIVRAEVAAQYAALDTVPVEPEMFIITGSDRGPYPALPITRFWTTHGRISVTLETAEQIARDLNAADEEPGLTATWKGDWLVFDRVSRYQSSERHIVEPVTTEGGEVRYEIGGLWRWDLCEDAEDDDGTDAE